MSPHLPVTPDEIAQQAVMADRYDLLVEEVAALEVLEKFAHVQQTVFSGAGSHVCGNGFLFLCLEHGLAAEGNLVSSLDLRDLGDDRLTFF